MVTPVPPVSLIQQAQQNPNIQEVGGLTKPLLKKGARLFGGKTGEILESARQKSLVLSQQEQVEFLQGRTFNEYTGSGGKSYTFRVEDEGVRVWVPQTGPDGQRVVLPNGTARVKSKLFGNVSTIELENWLNEQPGVSQAGRLAEPPEEPTGTNLESEIPGLEQGQQFVPTGTPARFIKDDPYDRWLKIGDDEALSIQYAPEERASRQALVESGADIDPPEPDLWDFNSNTIPDENGIHARIQETSEIFRNQITEETRGKISHEATQHVADLIGASPAKIRAVTKALLERQKGHAIQIDGMDMASTMLAARNLMVAQMRRLDDLAALARDGDVDALARFRYQLELVANIQRQYKGAQTETARALSAMRVPARDSANPNPLARENAEVLHKQDLTRMLEDYGGDDAVREMARKYLELEPGPQRNTYTRGLSRWRRVANAAYEVWRHALLTNPISQTKNIVGGIVGVIAPNVELAGAVLVGAARRRFGAPANDTAQFSDLQAQMFGQMMALKEATIASGKAFWTRQGQIPGSKLATTGTDDAHMGRAPAWSRENFEVGNFWGNVIDITGNIMTAGRVSYRTLEAGDTFFKTISARGEMYKQALITGRNRGLRGEDLTDYIAEFIMDPPAETVSKMETTARYNTLQTKMDKAGRSIQTLASMPILRYFLPFVSTPYNAAKWAFADRTILGRWAGSSGDMMRAGGKQRDEAIARMTIGTSVGVATAAYVAQGQITGGGPADRNLKNALRAQGWQPYSIRVGDKWVSYAGLEPFASVLGTWADVGEILLSGNTMKDQDARDLIGAALGGTIYNVSNKTFMQGFANLGRMIADPSYYGVVATESLALSLLPRGAVYFKRLNDPVYRDARTFIDKYRRNTPGLSKDLNAMVSPFGEDIVAGVQVGNGRRDLAAGPDVLSPAYLSEIKETPLTQELIRIGRMTGTAPALTNWGWEVSFGNIFAGTDQESFSPTITLDDDRRHWLQQRAGRLGVQKMEQFMETNLYQRLHRQSVDGDEYATELLTDRFRFHYGEGKKQALKELQYSHPIFSYHIQLKLAEMAEEELARRGDIQ